MTVFITSDWHFGHNRDFIYKPRGFSSIEEHDKSIIERHNSIVKPNDIVYCLGDCMLGGDHEYGLKCLQQLNGEIHIVRGNHDTDRRWREYNEIGLILEGYATVIQEHGYRFYLCHYPTIIGTINKDDFLKNKLICLCGHVHAKNKFEDIDKGLIYHIELDCQNNYPISLMQIILDLKSYKNFPVKS